MAISKEALNFAITKAKETTNKRVSKYQKYEEDILYLKKQGFSVSKIAKFLEEIFDVRNDTSLTALQNFIKVRENKNQKNTPNKAKQLIEHKSLDKDIENVNASAYDEIEYNNNSIKRKKANFDII